MTKYKKYFIGGDLGPLQSFFNNPTTALNNTVSSLNSSAPMITQSMSGKSTDLKGGWGVASAMTKDVGKMARNAALNTVLPGVGGLIGSGMDLLAGAIDKQKCVVDETTGEEICYDANSKIENVGQELLSGNVIGAIGTLFGKEKKFDPTTITRRNEELRSSKSKKAVNEGANTVFQQRANRLASGPSFTAKKGGKFYFKSGGKWMNKVSENIKKKGTEGKFTEWCKSRGYSKTTCGCVSEGKKSNNTTTVKRATLAGTFLNCR